MDCTRKQAVRVNLPLKTVR